MDYIVTTIPHLSVFISVTGRGIQVIIDARIHQGSNLVLTLFLTFINDRPNVINPQLAIYTDDTTISYLVASLGDSKS